MIGKITSGKRAFIKDLTLQYYWDSLSSLGFCNDSDKDPSGRGSRSEIPAL